jgi:hypothetical protein
MRLVILTVLLATVQTVPPVPRQTTNSITDKQRQPDKTSPAAAPVLVKRPTPTLDNPGKQPGTDNTEHSLVVTKLPAVTVVPNKRDWVDWGIWFFNLGLVVVGVLQWYVLRKQARLLDQHAKHFKKLAHFTNENAIASAKNAEAAKDNAQAFISSQRPWLLIPMGNEFSEIGGPTLPDVADKRFAHVTFRLQNFGQTPARVIEQKIMMYIGANAENTPNLLAYDPQDSQPEDYTFPQGTQIPFQALLNPNGRITPQERTEILASRKFLWLCGYCKYMIASEMKDAAVYESRFCYIWINNTNRNTPFWIARGPREYNRAI